MAEADSSPHVSNCEGHALSTTPEMSSNVGPTAVTSRGRYSKERKSVGIGKESAQCAVMKVDWRCGEGLWKWGETMCQGDGKM